jgi:transposase
MSKYPDWVVQHRRPGTEIKHINGQYYLYEVSSHWDAQKKRARKRSGGIIGKITTDGIAESTRHGQVKTSARQPKPLFFDAAKIAVKEYGLTCFIEQGLKTHLAALQKFFPEHWRWIVIAAYCRLAHTAPIKRMPLHFAHSFLSETHREVSVSDKNISLALRDVGRDRDACNAYMRSFVAAGDHIMVDMTDLPSQSRHIPLAKKGYSAGFQFDTQFNLLYIYSAKLQSPVFYRLLSGNLRESKAVKLLLKESGVQDCVFVADKGFYSKDNVSHLAQLELDYVIPLKRDSHLILTEWLHEDAFKKDVQYFDFDDRFVWVQVHETEAGQQLYLFLSEYLKSKEEHDYLGRIKTLPEKFSVERFHQKRAAFGTLALATNLRGKTAKEIYTIYKSRCDIELMFDHLKTELEADRTYMQNEETLQGWMFANHVALQWYYVIYHHIVQAEKLKKCSVSDVLECLKEVRKIRIDSNWVSAEITTPVRKTLTAVKIHIP